MTLKIHFAGLSVGLLAGLALGCSDPPVVPLPREAEHVLRDLQSVIDRDDWIACTSVERIDAYEASDGVSYEILRADCRFGDKVGEPAEDTHFELSYVPYGTGWRLETDRRLNPRDLTGLREARTGAQPRVEIPQAPAWEVLFKRLTLPAIAVGTLLFCAFLVRRAVLRRLSVPLPRSPDDLPEAAPVEALRIELPDEPESNAGLPAGWESVVRPKRLSRWERALFVLVIAAVGPTWFLGGPILALMVCVFVLPVVFGLRLLYLAVTHEKTEAPTAARRFKVRPILRKPAQKRHHWSATTTVYEDRDLYEDD